MKFRFDESCKIEGSEYILPYIISKWHDNIDVAYIYDYIVLNKRINKIAKEYGLDRDYILNLLKNSGFNRGDRAKLECTEDDRGNYCYLTLLPREDIHKLIEKYIQCEYKTMTFKEWLNDSVDMLNNMYIKLGYEYSFIDKNGKSYYGVIGTSISKKHYLNNKVIIHYKPDSYTQEQVQSNLDKSMIIAGNACRIIMDCLGNKYDYNIIQGGKVR